MTSLTNDPRPVVVLGFYGTTLDSPKGAQRWKRWRPSLGLLQQDDLLVTRFELLCRPNEDLREFFEDAARLSPETELRRRDFEVKDPWDFEEAHEQERRRPASEIPRALRARLGGGEGALTEHEEPTSRPAPVIVHWMRSVQLPGSS